MANYSQWTAAAFVFCFIMSVHYFILNVFVGVLVATFAQIRKQGNGVFMLTQGQALWLHRQRLALKLPIDKHCGPSGGWKANGSNTAEHSCRSAMSGARQRLKKVLRSKQFEAVLVLIVVIGLYSYGLYSYGRIYVWPYMVMAIYRYGPM